MKLAEKDAVDPVEKDSGYNMGRFGVKIQIQHALFKNFTQAVFLSFTIINP